MKQKIKKGKAKVRWEPAFRDLGSVDARKKTIDKKPNNYNENDILRMQEQAR